MTEEMVENLKKLKADRIEGIREIKALYAELEAKQNKLFDQAIDRINRNLQFFKDT